MHQKSIWKGITIFSLALGIGTFTSDFYGVKEISENVSNEVRAVEKKNCKFADPNLKYQTLSLKNEKYSAELINKFGVLSVPADKAEEKKNEVKESQNDLTEKIDKLNSELKNKSDNKNKEEYSTLLHKELCYESDGRK